jgi:hypothetical protein
MLYNYSFDSDAEDTAKLESLKKQLRSVDSNLKQFTKVSTWWQSLLKGYYKKKFIRDAVILSEILDNMEKSDTVEYVKL